MTHFDRLFPQDAFASQRASMISMKRKFLYFPVLFCLDTRQYSIENDEEYHRNSFLSTLCRYLSADLAFRYIQYKNFEELQKQIIQSSSQYSGFIIAQFPTSFDDLYRFESEVIHLKELSKFISSSRSIDQPVRSVDLHWWPLLKSNAQRNHRQISIKRQSNLRKSTVLFRTVCSFDLVLIYIGE